MTRKFLASEDLRKKEGSRPSKRETERSGKRERRKEKTLFFLHLREIIMLEILFLCIFLSFFLFLFYFSESAILHFCLPFPLSREISFNFLISMTENGEKFSVTFKFAAKLFATVDGCGSFVNT